MSYVDLDPLSPFAIVPSTWLAQLLANTEALHDGTGFGSHVIPSSAIDFGGVGAGVWWEEIARATLSVAGDTLSVSTLPARKYLRILAHLIPSGTIDTSLQFNGDTSGNYAWKFSTDMGSAGAGSASQTAIPTESATSSDVVQILADIINIQTREKLVMLQAQKVPAGAANVPIFSSCAAKWANTSNLITSISLSNGNTGDFAIGSEIIVLGHN